MIVLALVVLVVLALGFGTGWQNLWDRLSGFTSPVNVDAVKQACSYACATQSEYDWSRERTIRYMDKEEKKIGLIKCSEWTKGTGGKMEIEEQKDQPIPPALGEIDPCPAIPCT